MATITSVEREPVQVQEPRLASPLSRLGWLIRSYVLAEGLAMCVMVVCLWFWATLAIDWLGYKLFNFDYIRDGDRSGVVQGIFRGVFLVSLIVGPWIVALAVLAGVGLLPALVPVFGVALAGTYWDQMTATFGGWFPPVLIAVSGVLWLAGIATSLAYRLLRSNPDARVFWQICNATWMTTLGIGILGWLLAAASWIVVYNTDSQFFAAFANFSAAVGSIGAAAMFLFVAGMAFGWYDRIGLRYHRLVQSTLGMLSWLGGLVGVFAYKFLYRLAVSFNTTGLALAVERKYPKMLGDRLMTAIELGDRRKADRFGYSWVMIEQTRSQALERIGQVQVGKLLRWSRLFAYVIAAVVLVGSVAGFSYAATDTTSLWWDRTAAFGDRHWPREIIIDIPELRGKHTKAVPFGSNYPVVAEAWRYVVFSDQRDSQGKKVYPDDHRPLEWHDVFPGEVAPRKGVEEANRRTWELAEPVWDRALYESLHPEWRDLTLDQVDVRRSIIRDETKQQSSEAVLWRAQLGKGIIDVILNYHANKRSVEYAIANLESKSGRSEQEQAALDSLKESLPLLDRQFALCKEMVPEDWREFPMERKAGDTGPVLREYLLASRDLTSGQDGELKRLQTLIKSRNLLQPQQLLQVSLYTSVPTGFDMVPWLTHTAFNLPALNSIIERKQNSKGEMDQSDPPVPFYDPLFFRRDLSDLDRSMFPQDWTEKGEALIKRLDNFGQRYLPEHIGLKMVDRLDQLFSTLDAREEESRASYGKRRYFRKLEVPESVRIVWDDILSDEDKARGVPARSGRAKLDRDGTSNRYYYDKLNKIETAKRFAIRTDPDLAAAKSWTDWLAGLFEDTDYQITPWYYLEVRDLPALIKMWKVEERRPGYVYGGNQKVKTHPAADSNLDEIPLLLGSERTSVAEVPIGTDLTFAAQASKPLSSVRVLPSNQRTADLWYKALTHALAVPHQCSAVGGTGTWSDLAVSFGATYAVESQNLYVRQVDHEAGSDTFKVRLHELVNEEVSLKIEFTDTHGITSNRTVVFRCKRDLPPVFDAPPTGYEHLRQTITDKAIIPFSIRVHDDYGLTKAGYEVTVVKDGQKVIDSRFFPLRQFRAPREASAYPPSALPGELKFKHNTWRERDVFSGTDIPYQVSARDPLAGDLTIDRLMGTYWIVSDKWLEENKIAKTDRDRVRNETAYRLADLAAAQQALLNAPVAGGFGVALTPPLVEFNRTHAFRHPPIATHAEARKLGARFYYPAFKPPIDIDDEFFDTAELLGYFAMEDRTNNALDTERPGINPGLAKTVMLGRKRPALAQGFFEALPDRMVAKLLEPPYQLQIKLVAYDNCVRPKIGPDGRIISGEYEFAPQPGYAPRTFIFDVKRDTDVTAGPENKEKERRFTLAERLRLAIVKLDQEVARPLSTLPGEYDRGSDDKHFESVKNLLESLRTTTYDVSRTVENDIAKEYRTIFREWALNRLHYDGQILKTGYEGSMVGQLDRLVCLPLEELLSQKEKGDPRFESDGLFAAIDALFNQLGADVVLEKKDLDRRRIEDLHRKVNELIYRLNEVYKITDRIRQLDEIIQALERVSENQKELNKKIEEEYRRRLDEELGGGTPKPKP